MSNALHDFIKSPLNYIGGKYKVLPQMIPLFPSDIRCFVDLFSGGGNVGVNVAAERIILNDNLTYLMDLYKELQNLPSNVIFAHIAQRIKEYALSLWNEEGYKSLRRYYNSKRNPLDLFVLVSYSFNHQIRFNNMHEFNNPFGRERSHYNTVIEKNLQDFAARLQNAPIELYAKDFTEFDCSFLGKNDFVYCDPPYLITTGSYNDGKRGFKGWGEAEEKALLDILDSLNARGIRFALSNVLRHKGRENKILQQWLASRGDYYAASMRSDYSNSNYQTKIRDKSATEEVLITNYPPVAPLGCVLPLFQQGQRYEIYWQ